MSQVLSIAKYRNTRKEAYLSRFSKHLESFLVTFANAHLNFDFRSFSNFYFDHCRNQSENAWDYQDMRDTLQELIEQSLLLELQKELETQWWYDARWLKAEELIEQLLSLYINGQTHSMAL